MSGDVFAEPMLEDDGFLQGYVKKLKRLQEEGHLPADLNEEMSYKVYSIEGGGCGSGFGNHRSIVLSPDNQCFFSVELGFMDTDDGTRVTRRIYPVTKRIDPSLKSKFEYHGQVKMSTGDLLARGVATMKKFGSYFKFWNNCQDFCNYYLKSIGLGHTEKPTDSDLLAIISSAVAILALFVLLLKK